MKHIEVFRNLETEKIIGICCLGDFDEKARRAEIGYDLIRAYWNNGYATEAINSVVNFGVNEMNLNRIEAFITPGNDASVRVLEKANFIKEGIVRQRDYIKDKLEDGILMAILQSDLKTASSKTEEVNIKTERLLLRELKPEDYDFYLKIEKNEACLKYEDDTIPIEDDIRIKFNNNLKDRENRQRTRYRFMITDVKNKELIGRIILWRIDESINEWEIGWDVLPEFWGNGFAPEAAKAVLKYAFENLKVHRVQALCNDKNINSEKVMIKIGMKREGTIREVRKLNDQWYGSHLYSLLKNDYLYDIV